MFLNTSGSPSSTVYNVDHNDRARSNGQDVKASSLQQGNRADGNGIEVQSQRTNIASLVEVPRRGENQLAPRVKNDNRVTFDQDLIEIKTKRYIVMWPVKIARIRCCIEVGK